MFYDISYQKFKDACEYGLTEDAFDNDLDWQNLKSNKESMLQEENLEKKDLSQEEITKLESESEYINRAKAFEKAFFGNDILYEKFQSLIAKDKQRGLGLAWLKSEFFRWLIKNFRGNHENAKIVVSLYKSMNNFPMYAVWKTIGIVNSLPVGRI